jgi:hypothetical protein
MLIKAERRIPTHIHEGTNSWYRQLAPRLLMMFRRVLRSPTHTAATPPTLEAGGAAAAAATGGAAAAVGCRDARKVDNRRHQYAGDEIPPSA